MSEQAPGVVDGGDNDAPMDSVEVMEAAVDEEGWTTARSSRRSKAAAARSQRPNPKAEANQAQQAGRTSALTHSPIKKPKPPPAKAPSKSPGISRRASRDCMSGSPGISRRATPDGMGLPGPAPAASDAPIQMSDLKLLGVPLTRSRSERARLLNLATDALSSNGNSPSSSLHGSSTLLSGLGATASPFGSSSSLSGLALSRSKSESAALGSVFEGSTTTFGAATLVEGVPPAGVVGIPLTRSAASELALTLGSFAM